MRGVVNLRSRDMILGDFSHTLLVLYAMFNIRMGYHIGDSVQSCIRLQISKIWAGICAVFSLTPDGVSTSSRSELL